MKKLKKLFAALLALAMLLSLTIPAFASAVPHVDPRECPYCGVGTYSEHLLHWTGTYLANKIKCTHGWEGEWDGMLQDVYTAKMACSNSACADYLYAQFPLTKEYLRYVDRERICTHEYGGMSLGDVVS